MSISSPTNVQAPSATAKHSHHCPRCEGQVFRVPRHSFDFIISRFVPVRRYRCRSNECGWEGRQRNAPTEAEDARQYLL